MDFSGIVIDASGQVADSVDYVLALNIQPAGKQELIEKILTRTGVQFYAHVYDANSQVFDSATMKSVGLDLADGQAPRLAEKIVRNYALSRDTTAQLVHTYFDSLLGQAQEEAFKNAVSMQKHPTLERILNGDTCEWCIARVGVHVHPTREDFARHRDCDCSFIVSGYNSRNGLLKNYVKKKG